MIAGNISDGPMETIKKRNLLIFSVYFKRAFTVVAADVMQIVQQLSTTLPDRSLDHLDTHSHTLPQLSVRNSAG
jgi:hypothetical protein